MASSGRFADQSALAAAITAALVEGCPDGRVSLRGSLASGTADEYSDIDLDWVVPDDQVGQWAEQLPGLLASVAEVASLRSDPDCQRSGSRRLIFVRFRGLPLFWRLDLALWAVSSAFDADADAGEPRVSGDEWSLAESAAMNAVGAIKAVRRGRVEDADGLLSRGFQRIGARDPGGTWRDRVAALAGTAARAETRLDELAAEIRAELGR